MFKLVTKEEFREFLKQYPRELSSSVVTICEPPIRFFRDETLPTKGTLGGVDYFFDKVVARVDMDWADDNGYIDKENSGCFWEYSILKIGA